MARGIRKSITLPGLLELTVRQRYRELGEQAFAPYAVELVCYDLRSGAAHTITAEIAKETPTAQDAVDRELVLHYQPSSSRTGLLIKAVDRFHHLQEVAERSRDQLSLLPPLNAVAERVTFPEEIWKLVDQRWRHLGYRSLSAYVTGLIRYDLLVGGPHRDVTGDIRSKEQRSVTRKTVSAQLRGATRKTLLDHMIDRAQGRRVKKAELENVKAKVAQNLREMLSTPKHSSSSPP